MPVTPNSDPLGILTKEADPLGILEKKSQNGSNLSVGANGQLKESVPATLPSETQSKSQVVPDFGMASFSELAKGQRSQAENTTATNVQDFKESVEEKATREQRAADKEAAKKRKKDALPIALDDAAKRSLKIKGLDPNNKALLNKEKSKFALEIAAGNADVGFDKEGRAGLVTTPGFLESFHSSTMDAINFNKEAREFHKMNVAQRVEFVKRKQQEQEQKQNESQYVGERPTEAGSFGQVIGGATPALGLYGAGALAGGVLEAAAPATGGLSNLALKPVMSFVVNAGMGADHKAMENVLERYHAIKSKNPEIDDDAAMAEAGKGEDVDRLAGITESALFSKTGSNLNVGKSATGNILKGMAKAGIDIGGKIAITEGLADVGHNVEGVTNKSISDIAKDMFHAFEENAPMGAALHGFMTVLSGAAKVPGLIKSALKYDVVTKMKPEEIKSALDENVQRGAITPEDAEKASNELTQFAQVINKTPAGLSEDAQASAAGLILKRDNLKKEAEGKDESANDMNNQEIESINNQIKEIYRTDKPLEHEINPATGETFKKPTFDNIAATRVKNLADKISKGKEISDPEDLQTQANFPQELDKQLQKVLREEKSANKDKEKPNNEISDNVNGYLKEQSNEAEKSKVPVITEKAGVADEGVNKVEQPTEEIKKEEPVQSTVVGDNKTDAEIENRMLEIQDSNPAFDSKEQSEFNALEKEMEKREKSTVFDVSLEKVSDAVDALMKKEKEMPNGFGAFIEKRDASETKQVAEKYANPKKVTDSEIKNDFKEALMGNPTTWYADGLKLRESMKEAANRGIDIEDLLKTVEEAFTDEGWDKKVARDVIAGYLKPIYEGSQKVETDISKQLPVTKEDAIKVAIDNAGDVKSKIYQEVLKSGNESDISDVLKEVSDQWHDEGTRMQTERDFGKPIVDAAKELFPQESQKSLLPKETSVEEINKQREAELKEIPKPDVKLELISNKDLVNSKNPVETKLIHDKIKDGYKILKQMVDCL